MRTQKSLGLSYRLEAPHTPLPALALASGVAPMLFARIFDVIGSYDIGFLIGAGLFASGVIMILTLGRYPDGFSRPSQ